MIWWFGRKQNIEETLVPFSEQEELLKDIRRAHSDWIIAQRRLDWVIDRDQIDYAIYALEAAEKKYEMLLRQAKQMSVHSSPAVWSEA